MTNFIGRNAGGRPSESVWMSVSTQSMSVLLTITGCKQTFTTLNVVLVKVERELKWSEVRYLGLTFR